MIRLVALLALQLLLYACASGREPGEPTQAPSGAGQSPESDGAPVSPGSPGPRPSLTAVPIHSGELGVVTGTLGFDAVEGGCGYIETADGKRYQVIYPDGWRLDRATGQLLGPDGQSVKPGGVVSVRGSIATDIASICQVGPMFRAVEVLRAGE